MSSAAFASLGAAAGSSTALPEALADVLAVAVGVLALSLLLHAESDNAPTSAKLAPINDIALLLL
ncbi:hypothetical protein [Novosphingobium sp. CCH12-A3]|uniref:hypothetical protein n=1 Tax=Novosphingobium sp. CCH12-A3 TaxID=1768752 RepID=UPI000A6E9E2E|nr:hypothetical protein [Novosphingobium sp. CCH12-A3]